MKTTLRPATFKFQVFRSTNKKVTCVVLGFSLVTQWIFLKVHCISKWRENKDRKKDEVSILWCPFYLWDLATNLSWSWKSQYKEQHEYKADIEAVTRLLICIMNELMRESLLPTGYMSHVYPPKSSILKLNSSKFL